MELPTCKAGQSIPCLCNYRLEWWERRGFYQDPIAYITNPSEDDRLFNWRGRGFYFYDESWAWLNGPFPSYNMAQVELLDYCNTILGIY